MLALLKLRPLVGEQLVLNRGSDHRAQTINQSKSAVFS